MTLYHCSPTPGLKTLRPGVTQYFGKPRAAGLPMALAARESMEEQAEHKGGTP